MIPTQIIETLPYPPAIDHAENGPFQGDLPAAGFMSDHHTQQCSGTRATPFTRLGVLEDMQPLEI